VRQETLFCISFVQFPNSILSSYLIICPRINAVHFKSQILNASLNEPYNPAVGCVSIENYWMNMAENHAYKLRIVAIVCYIAAIIGVALRFYVRKYVVGRLGIEDWLMAVGLVSFSDGLKYSVSMIARMVADFGKGLYTMYISFVFVGLHYGTGQHHQDLPDEDIIMAVKVNIKSSSICSALILDAVLVFLRMGVCIDHNNNKIRSRR
jgi:hypothetical protein